MHKIAGKSWSEKIFKAYDIRGVYPAEINEDAAYKIARAFARYLRMGKAEGRILKILVSSDKRESSPALKEAFVDGLSDEGAEIIDAGVTTTPHHYFAVNVSEADGGAMITASHLPLEFNGLKLSKRGAMPISEGAGMNEIKGDTVRGIFQNTDSEIKITKKDFTNDYIEFLENHFPYFGKEIKKMVSGEKIQWISFDTDEDRVMFDDEKGNRVPGDIITALLVRYFAEADENSKASAFRSTKKKLKPQVFQDFSQRDGARLSNSPAGEYAGLEKSAAETKLLVINLIGQVFMHQEYASPFIAIDKILEEYKGKTPFIILDWHADATSEKTIMGRYLDGKVSAVFGTHTHVPTADAKILPKGTAYISDIGMVGPYESIIGVEIEPSIERFVKNIKTPKNPVETGPIEVNAILLELSDGISKPASAKATAGKAVDIRHLREIVTEYKI